MPCYCWFFPLSMPEMFGPWSVSLQERTFWHEECKRSHSRDGDFSAWECKMPPWEQKTFQHGNVKKPPSREQKTFQHGNVKMPPSRERKAFPRMGQRKKYSMDGKNMFLYGQQDFPFFVVQFFDGKLK
jgi:hypothetical protein